MGACLTCDLSQLDNALPPFSQDVNISPRSFSSYLKQGGTVSCRSVILKFHPPFPVRQPVCAVCREPVTCDLSQLDNAPPPGTASEVYTPDEAMRDMQAKMAALYQRQKEKGGIIDVEAENNKYLLHISQVKFYSKEAKKKPNWVA